MTALILILIAAASAWPVAYFGHAAYDNVLTLADADGKAWLAEHEDRADRLIYLFYALALLALIALVAPRKWPGSAVPLASATLLLALCSLGAGAYIGYAGGKIRHREFRLELPPTSSAPETP